MTLKERIKEIEELSKLEVYNPTENSRHNQKSYAGGYNDAKKVFSSRFLKIIKELQTKNKELEAKLKESKNAKI